MKKNYKLNQFLHYVKIKTNKLCLFSLLLAGSAPGISYAQQSYTFTSAGATGRLGPSQGQINSAYASTNLNGLVTSNAGIQNFTVPAGGQYSIEVWGASGGSVVGNSGFGAKVSGVVTLNAGAVIQILVGQMGSSYGTSYSDGGGGGSFVATGGNLLFAAGGGGGAAQSSVLGQNASLTNAPVQTSAQQFGSAGAGYSANGVHFTYGIYTTVGQAFTNGGNGQAGGQAGGWPGTNYGEGGFGGGGSSCSCSTGGGGGGGGFVGGGGGACCYTSGYGGSSYGINTATNYSAVQLSAFGHGKVILTSLCNVTANTTSTLLCVGNSATLTTNAVSNYSWSTGSSAASIVVTPSVNTSYSVVATSSTSCVGSAVINVSVNVPPVTASTSISYTVCPGTQVTLTGAGADTYVWSNGVTNGVAFPSPSATTIYTVTGTNTLTGCTNVSTAMVAVYPTSVAVSPASATVCSGTSATITASGAASYLWSNNSPFPILTVAPAASSVYTVTAVTANFCTATNTVAVTVTPSPTLIAILSNTAICKGESATLNASGATTYSWSTGATTSSISVSPTITTVYNVNGVSNNCTSNPASLTLKVNFCTGINQLNGANQNAISVFPNPSNGEFTIKTEETIRVNLVNELGQVVKTITLSDSNNHQATVSNLSNGIYFIVGKNDNVNVNQKIIVNK